jgi:subtilisin family serine protease
VKLAALCTALALPATVTPVAAAEIDGGAAEHASLQSLRAMPALDPVLAEELATLGEHEAATELVPVVVVLKAFPDLEAIGRAEDARVGLGGARRGRSGRIETLLRHHFEATAGPVQRLLAAEEARGHAEWVRPFWIFNGFTAELSRAAILRIADHPAVEWVRRADPIPPPVIRPLPEESGGAGELGDQASEWNISKINAPAAWARGYRGQGVKIGGMDTGVRREHPDLTSRYFGGDAAWWDPYEEHSDPYDADGHGTHTMGTILGGDASGKDIGVAPDAKWIAARMWNDGGLGALDATDAIFQWFLNPDGDPETDDAPRAVSNSWGFDYDGCLIDFRRAVVAWRAAGIVPVFASGNSGPGYASSDSPGNYPETYSVGATDSSDRIASFSGRGPSDCDEQRIKPDVSAPGVSVRSCVGSGWQSWSGTSMATPHITGAAAVLLSVDPTLTVEEIEATLSATAVDLGAVGMDNDFGSGRLDLDAAVVMLLDRGLLHGTVTATDSGLPLADAQVHIAPSDREVVSDGAGDYTVKLAGGVSYTLEASAFGYETASAQILLPVHGDLTQDFPLSPLPAGPLTGLVRDAQGAPLVGAMVDLAGVRQAFTAADGSFDLGEIPVGEPLLLTTLYCELLDDLRTVTMPGGGGLNLDVVLQTPVPDDMESGDANGWASSAVSQFYSDQWYLSSQRAHSGNYAWRCGGSGGGDYDNYLDAGLVTRCYSIPKGSTLRFSHWISSEHNAMRFGTVWDGGLVEASNDGGTTWAEIFPAGGYPKTITGNPANVLDTGTPCYGGHPNAWEEAIFDLGQLSGEVRFRFRFTSDGLVTDEGWYIDDLSLEPTDAACSVVVSDTPAVVSGGETATWQVQVSNDEARPVTYDFWVDANGPGGSFAIPLVLERELEAGDVASAQARLKVPAGVTPGSYTVSTRMGVYADVAWAEDSFVVEVR